LRRRATRSRGRHSGCFSSLRMTARGPSFTTGQTPRTLISVSPIDRALCRWL
jgi:hypothetical protein